MIAFNSGALLKVQYSIFNIENLFLSAASEGLLLALSKE